MKKNISKLLYPLIFLSVISCSSEDSDNTNNINDNSVQLDFMLETNFFGDLTTDSDGNLYLISNKSTTDSEISTIKKVSQTGNIIDESMDLVSEDFFLGANNSIAISKNGEFIYVTHSFSNNILILNNDFSERNIFDVSDPSIITSRSGLALIENDNNDNYIFFDNKFQGLKRFEPNRNTAFDMVGNPNNTNRVSDGVGLNASFGNPSKIEVYNNVVYILEDSSAIREANRLPSEQYEIKTIIESESEISDFAIDENGDIYVLIKDKGIYLASTNDRILKKYLDGSRNLKNGNETFVDVNLSQFNKIYIEKEKLYLIDLSGRLFAISDFKNKLTLN